MSIKVLFFATLAEATGLRQANIEIEPGEDAASIFSRFERDHPGLSAHRATALCALNAKFSRFDVVLKDGDELAFFPPVSGG